MEPVRYETTWGRALLGALAAVLCAAIAMDLFKDWLGLRLDDEGLEPSELGYLAIMTVMSAIGLALGLPLWLLLRRFGRGNVWTAVAVGFLTILTAWVVDEAISRYPQEHLSRQDIALTAIAAVGWAVGWVVAYRRA